MRNNLLKYSILKISQCLENNAVTPSELLSLCLERIKQTKSLNAFITVTDDVARDQANKSDERFKQGKRLGILDGVPLAFKDNFNTQGIRTTCASKMLSNYYAPYNATVVQRLLDHGAVLIGKTNMDEFAMGSGTVDSLFGPTKNPWQLNHKLNETINQFSEPACSSSVKNPVISSNSVLYNEDFVVCGGSSGGSAVAVATGCCFGALGSDTGGSTRCPAALCGVVGLKPTYGLLSRYGLIPLCNSLDVPGVLARTVDDVALLFCIIAGCDSLDSTTCRKPFHPFMLSDKLNIQDLHIGIPKEYDCPDLSSEISELWKNVAGYFKNSGAKVSLVSLPHTKYSLACYAVLCYSEVASNFARYDGIKYGYQANIHTSMENLLSATRKQGFGDIVRERILAGNYFLQKMNYEKYFIKATQVRRLIYEDFQKVFSSGIDLLLSPVTLNASPLYSEWIQKSNREHNSVDDYCMVSANLAGLPAVSIPCGLSKRGLPLGLQLTGRSFDERKMLTVAKWLENQINFPSLDLGFENNILQQTEML